MDKRLEEYLKSIGVESDALDGWIVSSAKRDGEDVGFVITKGSEIHILPTTEHKSISRRNIVEFIQPLFDQYGYVTTRVPISEIDHKLRHVLGFKLTWQDNCFTYWAMTSMPFQKRSKPCR